MPPPYPNSINTLINHLIEKATQNNNNTDWLNEFDAELKTSLQTILFTPKGKTKDVWQDVLDNPQDEDNIGALKFEIIKTIKKNPDVAKAIEQLQQQITPIQPDTTNQPNNNTDLIGLINDNIYFESPEICYYKPIFQHIIIK